MSNNDDENLNLDSGQNQSLRNGMECNSISPYAEPMRHMIVEVQNW